MQENEFTKSFSRRAVICFTLSAALFFGCILRIAVTATTDYSAVQRQQSSYRLTVGNLRGTVYDRNMVPITNNKKRVIAAVSPTPRAITVISNELKGEAKESLLERLRSGKPALCELEREIECDGISCITVYGNGEEKMPASHIVGYTDSDGVGVSGLEKAYDSLLYSDREISFVYTVDGKGSILEGIKPEIENDSAVTASGVVTTLDVNIQQIAETAADNIEKGAVIVADAENAKIRALVSRPDFDVNAVAEYLDKENSPLLNRALSAYNVGSVFKPCLAAVAIESGKGGFYHNCTGKTEIIDRFFKCHKLDGHGPLNLKSGLANSCNTYFYNLAFSVGGDRLYNAASALGFGKSFGICEGISVAEGSLPQKSSLLNIAHLANFSIGQGELLVSPVAMLNLYTAIASNGEYNIPSVVEGTLSDGSLKPYQIGNRTRAMDEQTARILKDYLRGVIEEGTGASAKPKTVSAAGKTATAQTGKYEKGVEICQGWFCGFFPAEKPQYTVIVFSEDITKQKKSCGEIFAEIADNITLLNE